MKRLFLAKALHSLNLHRGMHSRNKKAMDLVAKGWSALQQVDRVIDATDPDDYRLHPYLRTAKENFELALEADNMNTHAKYWLAKLHLDYLVPGACKSIGAALLVEAAEMGDPDAQYDLGRRLRDKETCVQSDQQPLYYIEKAVDQLHPGALYLLGAMYLTGDSVNKDIASALWCFHKASEKGHPGAAIAYGSLLLKGAQSPESAVIKFRAKETLSSRAARIKSMTIHEDPKEKAKQQFQVAAKSGCDLGLQWLNRLEVVEKQE
ncbi:hypothetical protein QJS04_geneDACA020071 [Acorus gramineus]|uniref:Binding protein n=1 Tax=Acorus gramineus TaxID=55184 RepID=A0AAV9A568_ACOGR|nr:hypothetical protein QJS04_geneDACA020071 [Acorus gramineus]